MSAGYSFFMWGCFVTCKCNTSESFGGLFHIQIKQFQDIILGFSVLEIFQHHLHFTLSLVNFLNWKNNSYISCSYTDLTPFQYSWMFTSFKTVLIDSFTLILMNVCNSSHQLHFQRKKAAVFRKICSDKSTVCYLQGSNSR